ncbi:unnamed protein product [Onchocerca ochengi]|uniref:LITAF domain-containing protein n=2 Tax=Onchocerca TaxID=6281 RepID=A0A182E1M9_ONCOC|nr:unnamed protein product [Onchocerca ochengi]
MIAGDYPSTKNEEIQKNNNGDSNSTDATTLSSFPSPLSSLTNINENSTSAAPFHVNLISSTTPSFGPNPIATDCPYCQAYVVTSIQRITGTFPWIIMGICFLLGFFLLLPWCLCFIPFYMDNCLDVVHTCPSCKRILGHFTRI